MGVGSSEFVGDVRHAAATGEGGPQGISASEYRALAEEYHQMGNLERYGAASALAGEHQVLIDALNRGWSYQRYAEYAAAVDG